jgi:hypothetical protein
VFGSRSLATRSRNIWTQAGFGQLVEVVRSLMRASISAEA